MKAEVKNPRYSVLIPAKNGGLYLPACVDSVTSQEGADMELLVSDDHSTDTTQDYLAAQVDERLGVLHPPADMSMAEHWEWVLGQARGEWLIFVGQDDGLQSYFLTLADKLVSIAEEHDLKVISSRRAYWFWPGCETSYGDIALSYGASGKISIMPTRLMGWTALLGMRDYFDLPQMYTTSLFHRSVIERARKLQDGRVFATHPQDANLAAIAYSLESRYLYSDIPLGWVGSSPKSAGLAVTASGMDGLENLKQSYLKSVDRSGLKCSDAIGPFSIGSTVLYYWGALLETGKLRKGRSSGFLSSRMAKRLVFSAAYSELSHTESSAGGRRMDAFLETAAGNGFDQIGHSWTGRIFLRLARFILRSLIKLWAIFTPRVDSMAAGWSGAGKVEIFRRRSEYPDISLETAQSLVAEKLRGSWHE
ncbi:MAG: glycosyltransferase family 2 protein [Spirochaetales bacterium]|nr:glycosyltransferase family 2 protein [Spirochaetales bacterium]